ncbi:MAG: hypothetical protein QW587_04610 [Candidatus Bathyarchaeia archaeon]
MIDLGSVPGPPIPSYYLGKALVQAGGPIAVTSGASTGAVTFTITFPDQNYQTGIEWVSGEPPSQGFSIKSKNTDFFIIAYHGNVVNSAFNWRVWRLS